MEKSWIDLPNRAIKSYTDGVESFLDFAFKNVVGDTRIYCPIVLNNNWMRVDICVMKILLGLGRELM